MRLYLILILFLGTLSLKAQDTAKITAKAQDSLNYAGYPVDAYNQTLFYIKNSLGPLSAKDRANIATEKIIALEKDLTTKTDSILIDTTGGYVNIIYQDVIIVSITPEDAEVNNLPAIQLAKNYQKAISRIIAKYRNDNNMVEITKRVGLGLLIILVLILIIFYLNLIF